MTILYQLISLSKALPQSMSKYMLQALLSDINWQNHPYLVHINFHHRMQDAYWLTAHNIK